MKYNLLEEKWIPVLFKNGTTSRVGIIEALINASQIRQIAASNPMDRVAVLRFLLALLYWCKGDPPDKPTRNSFPKDWFEKLKDNKDCFNLLGAGKRFYQDCKARRTRPVTDLIQEVPAGNNFWHFRHSTDKADGLCSVCCALGLLRLPLFSVSGLSGPGEPNLMAGINGVPPVYVVPWGKSLFDILLVNWTECTNIGEPSWNHTSPLLNDDDDIPLLVGLTLLPRKVWLHEPDSTSEFCIGCGRREPLIKAIEFQTAGKQENVKWNDPHVVYVEGNKRRSLRAEDLTRAGRFRMDRSCPDLLARIVEASSTVTSLLIVGFATNKAKNIDVWERFVELPRESNKSTFFQQWQDRAKGIEAWLRKIIRGKRKPRKNDIQVAVSAIFGIRPHVESEVSENAGVLLTAGGDAWEQASRAYSPLMAAVAKSLSPGFTASAVQRRKQIAGVRPDIREQTKEPGKSRKKGGDN